MKQRILRLAIKDESDLALIEDTYGIRFYMSMTRTFRDLIEKLLSDFDRLYLRAPVSFFAASYGKIPALFTKQLRKWIKDCQIHVRKEGDTLLIEAGYGLEPHSFVKKIRESIDAEGVFRIRESEVPSSYREQPFVLLNRLKKQGYPLQFVRLGAQWKFAKMQTQLKTKPKTKTK